MLEMKMGGVYHCENIEKNFYEIYQYYSINSSPINREHKIVREPNETSHTIFNVL